MLHRMNVLGRAGDIVVEWDPDDEHAVERARGEWKRLKDDGYEFFEPKGGGGPSKRIKRFNKKLSRVIAAPGIKKPAERAKKGPSAPRRKAMAGGPNAEPVAGSLLR